jgi:predicted transcriptional regulator
MYAAPNAVCARQPEMLPVSRQAVATSSGCVPPVAHFSCEEGVFMRLLTLKTKSFDAVHERADARGEYCDSTCMFFESPELLLRTITAGRIDIIRLLRDAGPMTAEEAAASLARDRVLVARDLDALLDAQIVDLERDARYVFEFRDLIIHL